VKKKNIRKQFTRNHSAKLRAEILGLLERSNVYLLPERRVPVAVAIEVANRDLRKTRQSDPDARVFSALRAVSTHITLASKNKVTTASAQNSDLLVVGHPASTRPHAMTAAALRGARARWIAADERIADDVRSLVATAHAAIPGSVERRHAFARLAVVDAGLIPLTASIDPIIAVGGFGIGGNSSAARRARAMLQRRDRKGRFAEMGGGFSFSFQGLDGIFRALTGRVVGASGTEDIEIEVMDDPNLPDGVYTVPSVRGEAVKAVLSRSAVKNLPQAEPSPALRRLALPMNQLRRADQPSGWSRQQTAPGEPSIWTSEDGYFVKKDGDVFTLHRADLTDNSIGEEVARGDDWADMQKAATADQGDYEKVLNAAQRGESPQPPRERVSTDDGYDAIRDGLLEEGWSRDGGDPSIDADDTGKNPGQEWEREMSRRAKAVDAARESLEEEPYVPKRIDPTKNVSSNTSVQRRRLIDWARTQKGDFYKSVVEQHDKRFGKLTQKQWDSLQRGFDKDPNSASFDGRPADMSQEEADELLSWATSAGFRDAAGTVYTAGPYSVKDDGADAYDLPALFKLLDEDGYVPTWKWESLRKHRERELAAEADTPPDVVVGDPPFTTAWAGWHEDRDSLRKTGSETTRSFVDSGWEALEKATGSGRNYWLSKAERKLEIAEAVVNAAPDATDNDRVAVENLREAIERFKTPERPAEADARVDTRAERGDAAVAAINDLTPEQLSEITN